MYGEVIIPPAVQDELLSPSAPASVRIWISSPPPWLEVRTPGSIDPRLDPTLDDGELEAITLAQNCGPDVLLLIDQLHGRQEANRIGLEMIGTLRILQKAHFRGLLDIREAITRLQKTNFKAPDALLQRFLNIP
jgi:predicted nucleic acid-binding protein